MQKNPIFDDTDRRVDNSFVTKVEGLSLFVRSIMLTLCEPMRLDNS